MITEYVRYRIPDDQTDEFVSAYQRAAKVLDVSPFCIDYELARCEEEPARFTLRIHWTSVEEHLGGFRKSAEFPTFLAAVRPFIAHIEETQHYAPLLEPKPSVYDALGGAGAFFRLSKGIHEEMRRDALLGPMFAKAAEAHVPHLAMWLCEVFGGPPLYSETLGDISLMLQRHAGLEITDGQRERFVECVSRVVDRDVSDTEARKAIVSYFEWGTKIAQVNSKADHVPDPSAGVPRWGWGED